MRVLERRVMTNQEAFLALNEAKDQARLGHDEPLETSVSQWAHYLEQMGLAGGSLAGSEDTQHIKAMLTDLASFPSLTKMEKLGLVNLAEVNLNADSNVSVEGATLCDICLVVPGLRDWPSQAEISRLCQVIYDYKRNVAAN